jgi:ABC-2 type transport system permease protein
MRALWAVYKREVGVFFRSPIAYAIAFGLLLLVGLLFSLYVSSAAATNQQGYGQTVDADSIMSGTIGILTFLMFLIGPLLSMKLLSEEAREGTLEVLMTLPMSDATFVVGKFLAAWTYFTFILALTLVDAGLLVMTGSPLDAGLMLTTYGGAWLYGGTAIALSLIWSALTEDQVVAAFLGFATVLIFFLAGSLSQLFAGQPALAGASGFVRELSLQAHYDETLLAGIVRAEDIAYFILVMIAAIFITTIIVGTRRWRAA